jgi:Tfp pilus assembly protein PilV
MKKTQSGFSMIEVLVASTIMIMIVMMLGMLFQQTSQAWRTGKQRADTYQQVRALFGSIQRDASTAIDKGSLPKRLFTGNNAISDDSQSFSGTLSFYTLTGTGFDNDEDARSGQLPRRAITYVTYSGATRTVKTFLPTIGGGFANGSAQSGAIVNPNLNGATVELTGIIAYDKDGSSVGGSVFPAYVTVSAGVNSAGARSFDIGAASGGPDRTLGTSPTDIRGRDDVKTWSD